MKKQNKQPDFDIVNGRNYIWKTPTKIETMEPYKDICPHCSQLLSDSYTLISVENNYKAKVPGLECKNCGVLFVKQSKAIRNLIKDNENAKNITLNGETLWNYSFIRRREKQRERWLKKLREKLEILGQVKESIMLVTLKNDEECLDCVITNSKEVTNYAEVIVIHYSSVLAREIITSVYRSSRIIKLNGKEYKVIKHYYPSDSSGRKKVFPGELMPSEVRIKAGGGYFTSIKNHNDEIVNVLIYSSATQRFELARATYDHIEGKCFMDIGIFRAYVKEYGKPDLQLSFNESFSFGLSFDELRTESILHAYGYSVSESDGLKENERRELLAEIVDLELLTIPYIVRLLDFFIRTHKSDKYWYARDKWARDIKYISDYKVNPERFLIIR